MLSASYFQSQSTSCDPHPSPATFIYTTPPLSTFHQYFSLLFSVITVLCLHVYGNVKQLLLEELNREADCNCKGHRNLKLWVPIRGRGEKIIRFDSCLNAGDVDLMKVSAESSVVWATIMIFSLPKLSRCLQIVPSKYLVILKFVFLLVTTS
ncbi:hypothetical protein ACS0TY_022298 [Phlomoides rotata]